MSDEKFSIVMEGETPQEEEEKEEPTVEQSVDDGANQEDTEEIVTVIEDGKKESIEAETTVDAKSDGPKPDDESIADTFESVDDDIVEDDTPDSFESVDDEIVEDDTTDLSNGTESVEDIIPTPDKQRKESSTSVSSKSTLLSSPPPITEFVNESAEQNLGLVPRSRRQSMIEELGLKKVKFDMNQLDATNFQTVHTITVRHGSHGTKLGLSVQDAGTSAFLPGVVITHVTPGSPASSATELSVGDLVVSVNDNSLVGLRISDKLKMLRATAKSHPTNPTTKLAFVKCQKIFEHVIKIEYGTAHGLRLNDETMKGIKIGEVETGSPAEFARVPSNHYILSVNNIPVGHLTLENAINLFAQECKNGKLAIVTMPAFVYDAQFAGKHGSISANDNRTKLYNVSNSIMARFQEANPQLAERLRSMSVSMSRKPASAAPKSPKPQA